MKELLKWMLLLWTINTRQGIKFCSHYIVFYCLFMIKNKIKDKPWWSSGYNQGTLQRGGGRWLTLLTRHEADACPLPLFLFIEICGFSSDSLRQYGPHVRIKANVRLFIFLIARTIPESQILQLSKPPNS